MRTIKSRLSTGCIKLMLIPVFLVLINGCEFILPNKPPYVDRKYPADSSLFIAGQVVEFQVNAYDVDGSVAHVVFSAPNKPDYTDDTPPYEFSWSTNGLSDGTYDVKIMAVDNKEEPYITKASVRLLGNLTSLAGKDTTFRDSRTNCVLDAKLPAGCQGNWTIVSGKSGLITDMHSPIATLTGLSCETYVLRWTVTVGTNQLTDEVVIGFSYQPSPARAGADQVISDGRTSTTLQATPPENGQGVWTVPPGSMGSFDNPASPNATFTGLPCTTYNLTWKVSTQCADSSDVVEIKFDQLLVIPDAGPDQSFTDGRQTALLAANKPASGTGTWTVMEGSNGQFANSNDGKTVFTGQLCQKYTLRWTLETPCSSNSDDVVITFDHIASIANAGPDQSYNDGRVTVNLNASPPTSGTGRWQIVNGGSGYFSNESLPNSTFTGQACNNYTLSWTVATQCNKSSDNVEIRFEQITVSANAGLDQVFTDGRRTTTLAAAGPDAGSGTWTVTSGQNGSFVNANDPKTTFSGQLCENYILRWTVSTACGGKFDEVEVRFGHPATIANAGYDVAFTGPETVAFLSANTPAQGLGEWSVISGNGGSFDDVHSPQSRFVGVSCQKYLLQWTISTACNSSSDQVTVEFQNLASKASAGADQKLTDGSVDTQLNANTPENGTGRWSVVYGEGGSFSNETNAKSQFSGLLCHTYQLRWTVSTPCKTEYDEVNIQFNKVEINADAGSDIRVSNGTVTAFLHGNVAGIGITGTWTIESGLGGSLADVNNPGTQFNGIAGQIYTLKWTLANACLENSDLVTVSFTPDESFFDARDGQEYKSVQIGSQVWMAQNLNYFMNGTYSYNNSNGNATMYGRLYDWSTAAIACPEGWHLPSDLEWRNLEIFLGMEAYTAMQLFYRGSNEGGMLKDEGILYWFYPNTGATNITGFTARPGGYRTPFGEFGSINILAGFWTSTEDASRKGISRGLSKEKSQIGRSVEDKGTGFSVRCIKN